MSNKDCLQISNGPTPCFRDVEEQVCSLNFCPAQLYIESNPSVKPWQVLHTHCVMSEDYGRQIDFEEGKGEYLRTIAILNIK